MNRFAGSVVSTSTWLSAQYRAPGDRLRDQLGDRLLLQGPITSSAPSATAREYRARSRPGRSRRKNAAPGCLQVCWKRLITMPSRIAAATSANTPDCGRDRNHRDALQLALKVLLVVREQLRQGGCCGKRWRHSANRGELIGFTAMLLTSSANCIQPRRRLAAMAAGC